MVKRDLFRNIVLLIGVIVVFIMLRIFFFTPYTVKEADANSYLTKGDFILAVKKDHIEYDDLVLYKVDNKEYIGRVVAKEKDTVAYMDNVFYLNTLPQDESYLSTLKEKYLASPDNTGYFTHDFNLQTMTNSNLSAIPKKQYLILNDNRQNNHDSREMGLISRENIEGVVTFRLSPLNKFGFIETR